MPWNQARRAKEQRKMPPKTNGIRRYAVLAGIGIMAVLVTVLLMRNDEPITVEKSRTKKRSVAEAKAALIRKVEAKTKKKFPAAKEMPKPSGPKDLGFGFYTNKAGEVKARTRPAFVLKPRKSKELFSQPAENFLAAIVNTPLGQPLYDQEVPENFEEMFKQSLTNKIVITENDTPDEVLAKQRTIDAKEFIRDLMRKGEDVREIILEEKRIIQKKHESYMMIEQGLMELRGADASPDEIAEYALAAKQLMKELELEDKLHFDIDESDAMEKLDALINPKKDAKENEYE